MNSHSYDEEDMTGRTGAQGARTDAGRTLRQRRSQPPPTGLVAADLCDVQCVDEPKVRRARQAMKPVAAVVGLAETFRLLGDPTRLRIVFALSREELCVCDLANVLGVSQSVVSHSLRALRELRLVRYRKAGKIAYYALDDEHIAVLVREGFRHVEGAS
jgi:DNA-binding transcriptional ArsR family regulator